VPQRECCTHSAFALSISCSSGTRPRHVQAAAHSSVNNTPKADHKEVPAQIVSSLTTPEQIICHSLASDTAHHASEGRRMRDAINEPDWLYQGLDSDRARGNQHSSSIRVANEKNIPIWSNEHFSRVHVADIDRESRK
jgi:hypothetical protein